MTTAVSPDPTLDVLGQLDDPSRWVIVRNVPIFKEHETYDPKTRKPLRRFSEAELRAIAADINRREADEGVPCRLTLGHTLARNPVTGEEPPETKQPPHVGFARKAHVGRYGPKQQLGILADMYYRREDWDQARTYPYRSVELYPGSFEVTGVALLRRDPRLDLGVLTYARDEARINYSQERSAMDQVPDANPATATPEPPADPHADMYAAMHKHPAFQYMCKKYQEETGDSDMGGMSKYMADPSGTNTALPAPAAPAVPDDKGEVDRMQRGQEAIRYQRLQAEVDQLKKDRDNALLRYQRAERERDLVQLEAEGYQFDRAELLQQVASMPDEQYQAQRQFIVKYGRREAPLGGGFIPTAPNSTTAAHDPFANVPEHKINAVVRHQEQHGGSLADAAKAVMGGA